MCQSLVCMTGMTLLERCYMLSSPILQSLSVAINTKASMVKRFLRYENSNIELDPGFWTKTSRIQLLYGIWVNSAQLGIGLAFGLPAVQVPQLTSPSSKITLTRYQASWIASILTLFSPIGCLLSGFIIDRFGRKFMIVFSQLPMCIGWLCTGLAKTPNQIIIGRAITGIGCGMAMGPPRIYCTEITLPNMRGVIGAFPALAISLGISIQAGLGNFLNWETLCYLSSAYNLLSLFIFLLLPETPYYVLKTSTAEKARTTLMKFRARDYDIDPEMNTLLEFKADNDIRKLSVSETIKALFTRSSCKPFSLISIYILISQSSGVSCVLMWAVEILKEAKSSYNVNAGNLLMALTRLVVGTSLSVLLFKVGRKPMALTSAMGVSLSSLSLGCFIYYNDKPSLVPQFFFMAYMAFTSLGYNTLPFLMASELYPLQVRGLLSGITVSLSSFLVFGSAKAFPFIMDSIGLASTMLIFGTCSLLGTIFLYFYLPETKELTLQEIEEFYNSRRPTLVSQRRLLTLQSQKNMSTITEPKKKSDRRDSVQKNSGFNSKVLAIIETKKNIFGEKIKEDEVSSNSSESLKVELSSAVKKVGTSTESIFGSKETVSIKDTHGQSEESVQSEMIKTTDNKTAIRNTAHKKNELKIRSKDSIDNQSSKVNALKDSKEINVKNEEKDMHIQSKFSLQSFIEGLIKKRSGESGVSNESIKNHISNTIKSKTSAGSNDDNTGENQPSTSKKPQRSSDNGN